MADAHELVWRDGSFVPRDEATVRLTDLGLPFVQWVFEGIKAHWSDEARQLYLFRLDDHLARFAQSMKLNSLRPRVSLEAVREAIPELLRRNGIREDVHLRPMAYFLGGGLFSLPEELRTEVLVYSDPFVSRLRSDRAISLGVSSWARIDDRSTPPRIKAAANYQNSRLAYVQARRDGYDQPLLLNASGKVAEGAGATLFLVRGDVAVTPAVTEGILESITRATLLELIPRVLGLRVQERAVDRTECYIADEAFLCGTGAEITPVASIDRYPIGNGGGVGPLTRRLQDAYDRIIRGADATCARWLTPVYAERA